MFHANSCSKSKQRTLYVQINRHSFQRILSFSSDALIKFADTSSVTSILGNRNHTINGTHVIMRVYHQDPAQPNSQHNNGQKSVNVDQIIQENQAMKLEISNLQKSLNEAQIYSKTAYDTFQALREKFGKNNSIYSSVFSRRQRLNKLLPVNYELNMLKWLPLTKDD